MNDWFVLYTKPRNEKKVEEALNRLGLEAYCPIITVERQWSDRKKKVQDPLFRSYCFVRVQEENRSDVFRVRGVGNYVFWLGKPAVIRDVEINEIKKWLLGYKHNTIQVEPLQIGDKVIFQSGTLENHEAVISKINGKQLVLVLESLGYKMRVNLEEATISKL